MTVTQNTYTGNGSTVLFSFTFPYLETTDVKVSLNGTVTTAYTFANATTIQFNTAPANGVAIRIYRDTDDSDLSATFYPGSAIRSQNLNDNFTQNLYVTQEINNNSVNIDGSNPMVGNLNMNGFQIDNLATPTSDTDAVNRAYVNDIVANGIGDGDKGDIIVSGSGSTFTIDSGAITNSKVHASAGIVSSKLAFTQSGTDAVQRTVESKLQDVVSVKDFGADPTGVTDSTAAIQNACNAAQGKLLRFEPNGTYRCSAQIHMKGDVDGQGSTLMFYGSVIPFLVYQNSMGNLRNFTIDGANVTSCQVGLQVDTDFVFKNYCSYDLTVKNISNSNNTQPCTGAQFFKGSGATNLKALLEIRVQVTNVVATADGVVGGSAGKATGILVGFNAPLSDGNVVLHDCNVDTVSSGGVDPYEDSDGIHLLIAGHESAAGRGLIQVRDCVVRNTKKRGYKIQAPNAIVDNCICYGNDVLGGFETYAYNTTFSNCKYIAGTGVAFSATRPNAKFLGCYAEGSGATVDLVRVYTDADNAVFDSCEFKSTAAYATGDYGVMQIYEADDVRLCNTILFHNALLGCSLLLRNSATVSIDNCIFKGSASGINLWDSTGRVYVNNTQISAKDSCVSRTGNTSQSLYASNCRFTGGSTIVLNLWNSGGVNSAYAEISNCTILANGGGGAWLSGTSRITGCRVENQGTTSGIGIYLPGNAVVARNNSVANFSEGITSRYATNQEISDNVTISCTTPFDLTGSTPLVNTDNFSR